MERKNIMIIQERPVFFGLSDRTLFLATMVIFTLGILTALAFTVGVFIIVISLFTLFIDALRELATHLVNLYTHADSLGKCLLLLLVGYISCKVLPYFIKSVKSSLSKWR
jgi:ABC-type nickel/cobalt efflux system permease component RcnA